MKYYDLSSELDFGKYSGRTLQDVLSSDSSAIEELMDENEEFVVNLEELKSSFKMKLSNDASVTMRERFENWLDEDDDEYGADTEEEDEDFDEEDELDGDDFDLDDEESLLRSQKFAEEQGEDIEFDESEDDWDDDYDDDDFADEEDDEFDEFGFGGGRYDDNEEMDW